MSKIGNITMNSKDVLSAKLAEIFVTIEGRRWLLFQAKEQDQVTGLLDGRELEK